MELTWKEGVLSSLQAPSRALVEEEEDDDAIEMTHTHIGALTNFGVQTSDIKKLKEAGIATAEGVMRLTMRKLEGIKGISTAKAIKLQEAARNVAKRPAFQSAKDLHAEREMHVVRVTTGSPEVDAIFGGGVESGSITEFYGEFRTGKTQLCLTLCVTSFLPRAIGGGKPSLDASPRTEPHSARRATYYVWRCVQARVAPCTLTPRAPSGRSASLRSPPGTTSRRSS